MSPVLWLAGFAFTILLLWTPQDAAGAEIRGIRFGVTEERTRIVFDLSSAAFEYRAIADGDSAVTVLLPDVRMADDLKTRMTRRGLLGGARVVEEGSQGTRVVLEFARACRFESFTLDANETYPPRLVIDLYPAPPGYTPPAPAKPATPAPVVEAAKPDPSKPAASKPDASEPDASKPESPKPGAAPPKPSDQPPVPAPVEPKPTPELPATPPAQPETVPATPPFGDTPDEAAPPSDPLPETSPPVPPSAPGPRRAGGPRVVVIDPGHGGDDPGAVGTGLREKDVCLDVARRLHKLLSGSPEITPTLTRSRDVFIDLRERMQMADAVQADLFVSIHVNAADIKSASGVEVFFLSLGAASDEAARELAKLENEAFEIEETSADDEELPFSLSLRQSDTLLRSSRAAEVVLDHFVERNLARSRGVKQAGFAVLKSYQTPSVLVELGFVSSKEDREALKDAEHRQKLAEAMAAGIREYLTQFAPSR